MLSSTLAVVNAGKLYQNSSATDFLYVWLGHTELVNPLTDDALGVVNGSVAFVLKDQENLFVCGLGREKVLAFQVVEDAPQIYRAVRGAIEFRPGAFKQINICQTLRRTLGRLGLCNGLSKRFVAGVITQCNEQIGDTHFQCHRHSALKVESEVEFLFNYLSVRVTKDWINLSICTVAEEFTSGLRCRRAPFVLSDFSVAFQRVRYKGSILSCFFFVIACYPVETERVKCRKGQQNGKEQDCILILHDARLFSGAQI